MEKINIDDWKKVGVYSEDEAKGWLAIGIGISEVFSWKVKFMSPHQARPWKQAGFTVEDSWRWYYLGFTPSRAKEWIENGFDIDKEEQQRDIEELISDEDWKTWRNYLSDIPQILMYKELGFTPEEALMWDSILHETSIMHELFHDDKKIAMLIFEILGHKEKYSNILKNYMKHNKEKIEQFIQNIEKR